MKLHKIIYKCRACLWDTKTLIESVLMLSEKILIEENITLDLEKNKIYIDGLILADKNLINLLKVRDNDKERVKTFLEIIQQGARMLSILQGNVEIDWAKKSINDLGKDLKKNMSELDQEMTRNISEIHSKNFIELKNQSTELLSSLTRELSSFLDEENTKSAVHTFEKMFSKYDQELTKALNNSNNEQVSKVTEEVGKKFNTFEEKIKSEFYRLNEKIDTEQGKKMMIDKTTLKGAPHEDLVQTELSTISFPMGDLVERSSSSKGTKGNKGDHTIKLNENVSNTDTINIVFESKTQQYKTNNGIKKYLRESMENRNALVGVMVFDTTERYEKITDLPFYPIDSNKAVCIFDKNNPENLPLKLAYAWARGRAIAISQNMKSKSSVDFEYLNSLIKDSMEDLKMAQSIKKSHDEALNSIGKASGSVISLTNNLKTNLQLMNDIFIERI
jgi:hypothetical protein